MCIIFIIEYGGENKYKKAKKYTILSRPLGGFVVAGRTLQYRPDRVLWDSLPVWEALQWLGK